MIGNTPQDAELWAQETWYKRDPEGGYAFYWHHSRKSWETSASMTNSELVARLEKLTPQAGMKFDSEKPRYDLVPPNAIEEMAKVMTFGARKYAPNSWKTVPDAKARYLAAALRHAFAISRGETIDPESGLLHAAHLQCCAAFLTELHGDF